MSNEQPRSAPRRLGFSFLLLAVTGAGLAIFTSGSARPGNAATEMVLTGYGSSSHYAQSAPGANTAPGTAVRDTARTFTISGSVSGLYPSKTLPLVLTVTNPLTSPITVSSITTTVRNATASCTSSSVAVTKFSGSLVVAAGKTAKATVHVAMAKSAPNACQGKNFPFQYAGTGKEV
jgi:hypothetical protein